MPIKTRLVTTDHIVDEAVTTAKIAALAVTAAKIAAGAVIAEKIASGAVITEKLAAEAITGEKISAHTITAAKLNLPFHWVDGDWFDNSPSAGYISWQNIRITYNGTTYSIPDGNTNKKYIWWDKSDPNNFQFSDTAPSGMDPREDAVICINLSGKAYPVWQLRQVLGSAIVTDLITAAQINVEKLDAISANLGNITAGTLTSVIIQSADTPPRVRMDTQGFYYQQSAATGKYGTFKYGDGTKYGAGVVAFFCNPNYPPLAVVAEQDLADIRLYNRAADPASGKHEVGDLICVNGIPKICRTAGEPGTFENIVVSDGATGGSGSAGSGCQYIALNIGGTIYKVLHDGTL